MDSLPYKETADWIRLWLLRDIITRQHEMFFESLTLNVADFFVWQCQESTRVSEKKPQILEPRCATWLHCLAATATCAWRPHGQPHADAHIKKLIHLAMDPTWWSRLKVLPADDPKYLDGLWFPLSVTWINLTDATISWSIVWPTEIPEWMD